MKRHGRRVMAMVIAVVCMLGTPMLAKATDVGETSTRTLSADNSLESLSISGAELSPAFYYSTVSYTATVSYDVTEVAVTAKTSNKNAVIESILGNENLSVGENTIKIVVAAENGNKATYTVKLTRLAEGETVTADDDGTADAVDDNGTADDAAAGDNTADADITDDGSADGADVSAVTLPVGNTYFVPMDAPADAVPEDMVQIDLELEGVGTLHAYQYVQGTVTSSLDELDFYFVYGTAADGTAGWYQYDSRNGAFQRYNERISEQVQTEDNSALLNNYNLASTQVKQLQQKIRLMACVFLFIVAVLLIIIFSILWTRRSSYEEDVFEEEPELKVKEEKPFKKRKKAEEEPLEETASLETEESLKQEETLKPNTWEPDDLESVLEEKNAEPDEKAEEKTPGKKVKRRGSLLAYLGLDDDLPLDFGDVIEEDDEEEVQEEKPEPRKAVFSSSGKPKEDSNQEDDIEFIDL